MTATHPEGIDNMQCEEFIASVASNGDLSVEEAVTLTRAVLATLADRISGGEAQDLAAQLPDPLKAALISVQENAEGFSFEEFVERTAEDAGTDVDEAERAVDAVFTTLREAVTPGEFDDVLSQLPADFHRLGASQPR
jgi:uncharacterized protein (DUF2267 family)